MKKRLLALLFIFTLGFGLMAVSEAAASVSVNASLSGGGTYYKGQTVTVQLTYSGATFGSATADFVYDNSVLELVSSSDGPQSAAGRFTQSIINENGVSSLTCTATFKAVGTGNTTVSAYFVEGATYDFESISAPDKSVSIAVRDPAPAASGNADLSSLRVSAGSLSPAFSAGTTSYTVNVGNDVTTCTLSAQVAHSKATYDVVGSSALSVGKNVRQVIVTAENGSTKTYTINIYRAQKSGSGSASEDDGDDGDGKEKEEEKEEAPKEILVTVGDKVYIICENYETKEYPVGFQMTTAFFGENEIPVFKDKDLENTVVVLIEKDTGDRRWFFYDEENDSFYDTKSLSAQEIIDYEGASFVADDDKPDKGFATESQRILLYVILGTLGVLFIIIIALQIISIKGKTGKNVAEKGTKRKNKKQRDQEDEIADNPQETTSEESME